MTLNLTFWLSLNLLFSTHITSAVGQKPTSLPNTIGSTLSSTEMTTSRHETSDSSQSDSPGSTDPPTTFRATTVEPIYYTWTEWSNDNCVSCGLFIHGFNGGYKARQCTSGTNHIEMVPCSYGLREIVSCKDCDPVTPVIETPSTTMPGYYYFTEWNYVLCDNCYENRYKSRICSYHSSQQYDSTECDPEQYPLAEQTADCDYSCDTNTSTITYVVIVFGVVTLFLLCVLVICMVNSRRARRRVIAETRREMLEQLRLENAINTLSIPTFLNDTEVDNIVRQMPPPPPKYEEIPFPMTNPSAPSSSNWTIDESELPPIYEEISNEPVSLVLELNEDEIPSTSYRPVGEVPSSIPQAETVFSESPTATLTESDSSETDSVAHSNVAFERT